MKTVNDILEKPANEISGLLNIYINSGRIKFIDSVYYLIYSALHGSETTRIIRSPYFWALPI